MQRIPPTHAALEQHVKSVVFQDGHVWGQIHVTTCASFSGAWDKTDNGLYEPHWTTFPRPTTVGYLRHARKDVIAAASAKRLHALLSAGVKQLGKVIIVVLQFYTCITTEQAMHCIIRVTLLDESMALWDKSEGATCSRWSAE